MSSLILAVINVEQCDKCQISGGPQVSGLRGTYIFVNENWKTKWYSVYYTPSYPWTQIRHFVFPTFRDLERSCKTECRAMECYIAIHDRAYCSTVYASKWRYLAELYMALSLREVVNSSPHLKGRLDNLHISHQRMENDFTLQTPTYFTKLEILLEIRNLVRLW